MNKKIVIFFLFVLIPLFVMAGEPNKSKNNAKPKTDSKHYITGTKKEKKKREVRTDNWNCTSYGLYISRTKDKRNGLHKKRQKKVEKSK